MLEIRPLVDADRRWAVEVETASWGEPLVVRRGQLVDLLALPALVAVLDGERAGLAAYAVRGDECEVVTITSLVEGRGVGRALLDAVREVAVEAGCRRLWLVTTNDNTRGLRFFQRWGLDLVALRRHAVTEARRTLKPSLPPHGADGIPLAHELELELALGEGPAKLARRPAT